MNRRREMIKEYKSTLRPMGIIQVRNTRHTVEAQVIGSSEPTRRRGDRKATRTDEND